MIPWASEEDRLTAEQDLELYGNAFVTRGDDGKVRRIDPTTIHIPSGGELADAVERAIAPGRTRTHALKSLPAALRRYRDAQAEPKVCPRCLQPYGRHGRSDAHGPGFCIDRSGQ